MKTIFILFLMVVCVPFYIACVFLLIAMAPLLGGYVNASVYVCEYFQPIITALIAILFLLFDGKHMYLALQNGAYYRFGIFLLAAILYLAIIYICAHQLTTRISDYQGMTDPQIFDFVVKKLQKMGSPIEGEIVWGSNRLSLGYIVANFVTYLLPMFVTLLAGYAVRLLAKHPPIV